MNRYDEVMKKQVFVSKKTNFSKSGCQKHRGSGKGKKDIFVGLRWKMLICGVEELWGTFGRLGKFLSEFTYKRILLKESRAASFLRRMSYLWHGMSMPLWRDNKLLETVGYNVFRSSLQRRIGKWGVQHGGIAYLLK